MNHFAGHFTTSVGANEALKPFSSLLAFPPFQLAAQHLEKVVSRSEQVDLVLGPATTDAVAIAQIEAGLSIQAEIGYFIFSAEKNLDLGRIRDDEWSVC